MPTMNKSITMLWGSQENDKYWQQNVVSQPVSIWRGFTNVVLIDDLFQ